MNKIPTLIFLVVTWLSSIQCSIQIPILHTKGTYSEVGFDMGKTFKSRIHDYNSKDTEFQKRLMPYITSQEGVSVMDKYLTVVRQYYPQYLDELKGIAAGSEMPFIQIFINSIRNELNAHIDGDWGAESCSDVHVNNAQQFAIGHNEDADPLIKDRAYFVNATIVDKNGNIVENFMAYTYPGYLPGNAFGFTMSGLIMSVNALSPKAFGDQKLPRNYVNRALLAQSTEEDVEKVLLSNGIGGAYAFSCNFADLKRKSRQSVNYEVTSTKMDVSLVSKKTVHLQTSKYDTSLYNTTGHYFHFNKFEHPDTFNIPQFINHTISSIHRRKRAEQLPTPTDIASIRNILGDTGDSIYPIYRTPRPSDNTSTCATAIYDITRCVLSIYTDNPKTASPVLQMPLPNCS
ncbi:hypothetical protein SNE40_008064 [Patella caerulea]